MRYEGFISGPEQCIYRQSVLLALALKQITIMPLCGITLTCRLVWGAFRIVTLIRTDIRTKSKKYQNLLHSVLFVPMVVCGLKFIIDNKAGVYLLCDSQPHGKVGLNYCNGLEFWLHFQHSCKALSVAITAGKVQAWIGLLEWTTGLAYFVVFFPSDFLHSLVQGGVKTNALLWHFLH